MANQIMGISSVKVLKCTLTVVIELGVWGILPQEFYFELALLVSISQLTIVIM